MKETTDIVKEIDAKAPMLFTQLDRQFGDLMQRLSGVYSPELVLASRFASNQIGRGSVCVHIPFIAGKNIFDVFNEKSESENILLYSEDKWLASLKECEIIGRPGELKPLILDDNARLYLYRYWLYEQKLAENIKSRLSISPGINIEILRQSVRRFFKFDDDIEQIIAAVSACLSGFCVISGGPGTGKTSLVIKIIALLLENAENADLRIALAAPTGKAAARLSETVKRIRSTIDSSETVKSSIPDESYTLHRLLGNIEGTPYFRFNAENPLPFDIVVVDESSMADLALTAKLFEAVPVNSRLILLGDKDQLSSVEAGSVLGDICDTGRKHVFSKNFTELLKRNLPSEISDKIPDSISETAIADAIITLNRSYRFASRSGIGEFSRSIREGKTEKVLEMLLENSYTDIAFLENKSNSFLNDILSQKIIEGYSAYIKAGSATEALAEFPTFTILCAVRKGMLGVEKINELAEDILSKNGLIKYSSKWYEYRPIMITRNDYSMRLYNGDIGIILKDDADGRMRFFTSAPDGSIKKILPLKIPEHETVYAMTVHKSQGSEFDNVLIVLPDRTSPLLTRELLYTAVTRARKKVEIYGRIDIIRHMINTPTTRISGLKDALWDKDRRYARPGIR